MCAREIDVARVAGFAHLQCEGVTRVSHVADQDARGSVRHRFNLIVDYINNMNVYFYSRSLDRMMILIRKLIFNTTSEFDQTRTWEKI